MKRVLIIGAAGQDGTLLAESLKNQSIDYLGIERRGAISPDGKLIRAGTTTDPRFIQDVVATFLPTHVYYLAAHHHSSQDVQDTSEISLWNSSVEVQILGLVRTLDALRQHAPEARLFYASSSLVFGSPEQSPQNEETPKIPTNVYGITKVAGSEVCRHYREQHGLFASVGILYNHESIHRRENFLSKKVIQAAIAIKRGSKQRLALGDLSAETDWGYAPDYVDAMTRILELDQPGTYVIATGKSHAVREFVQIAFEQQGLDPLEWVEENKSLIQRRLCRLIGDASKLRRATGWVPSVSFPEMIRLISVEMEKSLQAHE